MNHFYLWLAVLGFTGVFLGWMLAAMKYHFQYKDLKSRFETRETEFKSLQEKFIELTKTHAGVSERARMMEEVQGRIKEVFEAASSRVMKDSNRSFLNIAETLFSKHLSLSKMSLDEKERGIAGMLEPFQHLLEKYEQGIAQMEQARQKAYGGLSQQVESLIKTQCRLQQETGNLTSALKVPQVRGRWGEITLKRVVELAGMQNKCDFSEQPSVTNHNGSKRPDMIVSLPGQRQIIVDAKTPLSAYLESLEAETDDQREECLLRHAKHFHIHIQKLAQKSYWEDFKPSPEFVVMFIPGENFFSAALSKMPDLIEEGARKGIILATPTTLISLLKAVSHGWNRETSAENAKKISELGRELLDRISSMAVHLNRLGREIEKAGSTYNQVIGTFERRVFASARKFKDLGVSSKQEKTILAIEPAEVVARETRISES